MVVVIALWLTYGSGWFGCCFTVVMTWLMCQLRSMAWPLYRRSHPKRTHENGYDHPTIQQLKDNFRLILDKLNELYHSSYHIDWTVVQVPFESKPPSRIRTLTNGFPATLLQWDIFCTQNSSVLVGHLNHLNRFVPMPLCATCHDSSLIALKIILRFYPVTIINYHWPACWHWLKWSILKNYCSMAIE